MTPPLERATYHHGDLRNALLEEAARLVGERGAEGFSLREAARAVGVSPTAAYRHFADKTALLAAVASDGFSRLAAAMEKATARVVAPAGSKARASATLAAVGEAYVEFALRHPARYRVMFGPWMGEAGDCAPGVGPSGKDPYQLLVAALDGLVESGAVRAEARAGAEVVAWSAVHGLAALLVDGLLDLGPRERAGASRLVVRSVLAGRGAAPDLAGPPLAAGDADPCPRRRGRTSALRAGPTRD
jgi:AcrR family transcriptional regulator